MILKAPSANIMNKLARSVLALYSYDDNPDDTSLENSLRQSFQLIARLPAIMTYAYQVKRRRYDHESMFFHPVDPDETIAESILDAIRPDRKYTPEEAHLLDLCMVLHAEHGGGKQLDVYGALGLLNRQRHLLGDCRGHRLLKGPAPRRRKPPRHGDDAGPHDQRQGLAGRRRSARLPCEAFKGRGGRPVGADLRHGHTASTRSRTRARCF